MEDINNLTIIGNLVKDAELKYTNSGTAITGLTIAVNRSVKKGDQWTEEASFFDVSLWGKRGESLNQYLQKGIKIAVLGSLKQDRWESDGQKRSRVVIMANNIQLLGGKKQESNQGNYQNNNSNGNNNNKPSYQGNNGNYGNTDKDIPF
jgi:single-strand DNA-binding protein